MSIKFEWAGPITSPIPDANPALIGLLTPSPNSNVATTHGIFSVNGDGKTLSEALSAHLNDLNTAFDLRHDIGVLGVAGITDHFV
jgi:hypothetical protein